MLHSSRVNLTRTKVPSITFCVVSTHFIPVCTSLPLSVLSVSLSPVVINNAWPLWRRLSILVLFFSPSKYRLLWLLGRLRSLPLHVPGMLLPSFGFLL